MTLGENSLDFVARGAPVSNPAANKRPLASFGLAAGGQTATAAVCAARLGLSARYIGAFGDDEWARRVRGDLTASGVEVCAVERAGVGNRIAVVLVAADGDRTILEHRDHRLTLQADDVRPAWVTGGRVLLVDATSPGASLAAAAVARQAGVPVLIDIDTVVPEADELLEAVDLIVVPQDFVAAWSGGADLQTGVRRMQARFPTASAIIVTRGPEGSVAYVDGTEIETHGYDVAVVDTTGAGDAFRGGLAAAWVRHRRGQPFEAVLAFANATAALNCRAVGAQAGLPSVEDVERLVTTEASGRSNRKSALRR